MHDTCPFFSQTSTGNQEIITVVVCELDKGSIDLFSDDRDDPLGTSGEPVNGTY